MTKSELEIIINCLEEISSLVYDGSSETQYLDKNIDRLREIVIKGE